VRPELTYPERSLLLVLASLILAGFTWAYCVVIIHSPEHRTYGAFVISGLAASRHLDPYAIRPGIWSFHPFADDTGPLIYDRNLQPPILLPLFQMFAKLSIARGAVLWMFASFALFVAGTAALLMTFREAFAPWMILLLLLSQATLSTIAVGEDFAILFVLAAGAVCFQHLNRPLLASICIGVLVAAHWNFGMWPVLLYATGHRRMAVRAACIAALLTALPMLFYGAPIYPQLVHAVMTDNHSYDFADTSIIGFFTRAGYRSAGFALSLFLPCFLLFAMRRKQGADPVAVGGMAACIAILCSPIGWYLYLVAAFPFVAARRADRFAAIGAALMFIPDRTGTLHEHSFIGHCANAQFFAATCLFFISFWRTATLTAKEMPPLQFESQIE
jgi:hypothetical protein